MSHHGENGDIKESFVEENKIKIEATCINLDCVKNEPSELFEEGSYATQYRISLEYENIFGESSQQIKIEEDSDNLIGFLNNEVIMENAMTKLGTIREEDDGSFDNFYCRKCKGIYKGYCLNCSILLHILNNNLPFVNSEPELDTIPPDILEIRYTSRGKGVYLLRTIPTNLIFGPFEGISGIESTVGHSWKIVDNKLTNIKSGNWMKHIVCAPNATLKNLEIFQIDSVLYFRTNREIAEGEELLIYYDKGELQQLDNSEECLYTPQKQEELPKIFACTVCCLGFGSNKCLMEHKRKSCRIDHSRSMKDFVLVECHYCKMWLEKWEHEEYHVAYCLEKHHRIWRDYSEAVDRSDTDAAAIDDCDTKDVKRTHQRDVCSRPCDLRGSKQYQCDISMKNFGQKGTLGRHVKSKQTADTNAKDYKCSECWYQTNYKCDIQRHLNRHRGIKPFKCDICMKEFVEKGNLGKHIKNKHTENGSAKDYKCLECTYQTNYKSSLQNHLNMHRGIKPFKCDICLMKFGQKSNLAKHIKDKHTADVNTKDYKCLECSFATKYKNSLQMHLNIHRGIKPFSCDICMKTFGQKGTLVSHVKNKHTEDARVKDYKCSECLYQTNYKYDLQNHLNMHRGIKPFKCDICMKKFGHKSNLAKHVKNKHTDDGNAKDYKCLECSFETKYKNSLKMHLNTHRGIKPFKRDNCMMEFGRKGTLDSHVKNKHTQDASVKDYKCSECLYQTNYKGDLQKHLNRHRGIKPFKCDICMKKFIEKGNLAKHIKNKHTDDGSAKDYKCLECTYQTNFKSSLQIHLNTHRGIKPFNCHICMMKFGQKSNLAQHIKNKHTDDGITKDYKCLHCSFETKYKNSLQMHLNIHRGIKAFSCDICMKTFGQKGTLDSHIKNKHAEDARAKDYKCSECSYTTNYKCDLQNHLNMHRGIKPFKCDICMKKFGHKGNLAKHIKNKHTDDGNTKDYKCLECSFETKYKNSFKMHLNTHRGIKPFKCDICMMKFGRKGTLDSHVKNKHTQDASVKDYKCSECLYQTNYKADLQKHLNRHRGIKPFKCDICMKKFIEKGNLAKHIKNKHTDNANAKDYKCLDCSYQTNYKSSLTIHVNMHKGIKPFKCDICTKEFFQRSNLNNHIKDKHTNDGGVKEYKCSECFYQTNYKHSFKIHLNAHRGIKPFQCDICVNEFTQKCHLNEHIKNKHRDYKDYKCSECSYQTNYVKQLEIHIRNKHTMGV